MTLARQPLSARPMAFSLKRSGGWLAAALIFALLPLGLGLSGHGSFISQPLAIIVIGGLVSSTLLTLVVLPVLYYLVEGAKERRSDRAAATLAPPVERATN